MYAGLVLHMPRITYNYAPVINLQALSSCRDAEMATEAPAPAAVPTEALDQTTAVKLVLKKALAHDGLARGLREVTRYVL